MQGVSAGDNFDLQFPVKSEPGRVALLEKDRIFYVEAEADDSLIRTKALPPQRAVGAGRGQAAVAAVLSYPQVLRRELESSARAPITRPR
jgi:hypothetical protein